MTALSKATAADLMRKLNEAVERREAAATDVARLGAGHLDAQTWATDMAAAKLEQRRAWAYYRRVVKCLRLKLDLPVWM